MQKKIRGDRFKTLTTPNEVVKEKDIFFNVIKRFSRYIVDKNF